MPRAKVYEEQIRVPLPAGMTAKIDAALAPHEPRLDLIRDAIARELKRRSRPKPKDA